MQIRHRETFTTIRTEGSLLPADHLQRISEGKEIDGLAPSDYHVSGRKLNEAINHSWNSLLAVWGNFKSAIAQLSEKDLGTGLTRERWLLPLFQELGYGRLLVSKAVQIDGKSYPISHSWHHTPIHLVGFRLSIDKKVPGAVGAARMSPHGMMQEYLNRSDGHLWGFVSNGFQLRILRDTASLTKQSYIEFDLEGMMEGEVYSDFVIFWLLCHQSRLEADKPEDCWLEKWSKSAQDEGTRALDQLRSGVEKAIEALGRGFLSHPANSELREKLRGGELDKQEYYRQILRLVYRLIFLFVAEDRGILLNPGADQSSVECYFRFYSITRLRRLAERKAGTRHSDLYQGLTLVMERLGSDDGCPELGISPLGSFLFSKDAIGGISGCQISNRDLFEAVRSLSFITYDNVRRPVDFGHIGSEELGSVYESLLELHPDLNVEAGTFSLQTASGHERKTTGSYYTPSSLVQCLLDSALEPVLDGAVKKEDPEQAILDLKVCDPACGSGHFLVAAAHRIAKRLASVRTGDDEPSPDAIRKALRDVIGRCIYGVDLNPMAVELCKVSLWLEAIEPGKPLSFLDHQIKCGNSLLGTTPKLIADGIPDDAFTPIEGDDKGWVSALKKRNKQERSGQLTMFAAFSKGIEQAILAKKIHELSEIGDDSIDAIHRKEEQYREFTISSEYQRSKLIADAWCAAFLWKKKKDAPPAITQDIFRRIVANPESLPTTSLNEINRLSEQYAFLHWHNAFPDVFRVVTDRKEPVSSEAGWNGGFDVVLGNPPWERIKLQEKEWFAERRPDIANAPNAAQRRKMIEALKNEDPELYSLFAEDRRKAEGESHLVRNSSRYPLCGRGDINTYAVFAEAKRLIMSSTGRVGCIVPSGIATDDTTKFFFQDLMDKRSLVSLYDFENRAGLFPAVDSRMKFCLLTLTGSERSPTTGAEFVFFAHSINDLKEPERRFRLTPEEITLLNPNTKTCPIFRTEKDAAITRHIYRKAHPFLSEGACSWAVKLGTQFHSSNDAHRFDQIDELTNVGWQEAMDGLLILDDEKALPLYEGKMFNLYDHRAATVTFSSSATLRQRQSRETSLDEHRDPTFHARPFFWVRQNNLGEADTWQWILCFKKVTSSTNERTLLASVLPQCSANDSIHLLFPTSKTLHAGSFTCLLGAMSSYTVDYVARQKLGGVNMNFYIFEQLPIHPPLTYTASAKWDLGKHLQDWLIPRILELTYTAWDLEPFAKDCGYDGAPFRWDEDRRFLLRCELDAAYFHLYGIERDDVDYIMETFPIVKRKDEQQYGEYRTKRVIMKIYDEMAESIRTGRPYKTRLDPPPADPRVAHPPKGSSLIQVT